MYISVGERISETIKLFHAVYTFLFVKKKNRVQRCGRRIWKKNSALFPSKENEEGGRNEVRARKGVERNENGNS